MVDFMLLLMIAGAGDDCRALKKALWNWRTPC
jgi:putative protein kinase ArgK-like GTPase of G3E family